MTSVLRSDLLPSVLPVVFCWGCGSPVNGVLEEETSETTHEIIGGTATGLRPEIFRVGNCTATVVHPRFAITAAHCMGNTGPMNTSGVINGLTRSIDYGYRLGLANGAFDDVALMRFATNVTPLTPTSIASAWPSVGQLATMFGFGCNAWPSQAGTGQKRFLQFVVGNTTMAGCPVDSGGPVVFGPATGTGSVFAVDSRGGRGTSPDEFGDAVRFGAPGLAAVKRMGTTFERNNGIPDFPGLALGSNVKAVTGDFNNDGCGDILLAGSQFWTTTPFAVGNCAGGFTFVNFAGGPDIPVWANQARIMLSGRFHFNQAPGHAGIALVGGAGWSSIPVGWPSFIWSTANNVGPLLNEFNFWARSSDVVALAGDFDSNGFTDIALTGANTWTSIPIAFSNGNGTFGVENRPMATFPALSSTRGVKHVVGDFDGDGDADIALTGGANWTTIPIAFSNRDGTFTFSNRTVAQFPQWMTSSSNWMVTAGDFDGDGDADIAATGSQSAVAVALAFSNRDGGFTPGLLPLPNFHNWGMAARWFFGARMNGDQRADLVLLGGTNWTTQPVAFSDTCPGCM